METGFARFYPAVQLLYFASVLSVTMMIMNPVLLVISGIGAALYIAYSGGSGALFRYFKLTAFTSAMIIVINPLISHKGVTVIAYLPDGNPLTVESIIFGIGAALMLSCIFAWFYSINRVFTSDKVVCLFGDHMPKTALLISMSLGFSGKFIKRFHDVRAVQKTLDCGSKKASPIKRFKSAVTVFSIMIQWAMESSVDTADSMKSRGYGLKKRTSYTVYRVFPRDIAFSVLILLCDTAIAAAYLSNVLDYSYYPYFSLGTMSAFDIAVYFVFAALCVMPLVTDIREDVKWRSLRSKI